MSIIPTVVSFVFSLPSLYPMAISRVTALHTFNSTKPFSHHTCLDRSQVSLTATLRLLRACSHAVKRHNCASWSPVKFGTMNFHAVFHAAQQLYSVSLIPSLSHSLLDYFILSPLPCLTLPPYSFAEIVEAIRRNHPHLPPLYLPICTCAHTRTFPSSWESPVSAAGKVLPPVH